MNNIDERIVKMEFDNKQFESGIQTSLKSLDSLKKGLNLDESAKALSNLEKAGRSFSLAGIASGVESISNKFSALGIVAITTLQNITNSAVNAGKRIVSALTIDPIKMGFQEYETQINAVQTILANTESKGKTLQDVNKALDELNAYADKTIYNFTEMTRNIGTFTAAGVDLDTSVSAIKGIANLAAVSGSTSQQASTAMYQLSQALASGTVKLMDWNSVVNAGMGGQVFQDALKETARVHKVAIDDMIESEGSFRETLSKGWLTSEILTETLSKFTGDLTEEQLKTMGYNEEQIKGIIKLGQTANDAATKVKTFSQLVDTLKEAAQSGWTQTWEIIVGDFEEAKVLLTEVSDAIGGMIGASAEARNSMLQTWKDLGGRTKLIEGLRNVFQGLASVIKPIKDAFTEIFPPATGEQLLNITEAFRKLTERFKIGETTANNLKRTFKGIFSILDVGVKIISAVASFFGKLIGFILPAVDGLISFTAVIGDVLTGFNEFLECSNLFKVVSDSIANILGSIISGVKNFVTSVADAIKGFLNIDTSAVAKFTKNLSSHFEPLVSLGDLLKKTLDFILNVVKKAANLLGTLFGALGTALGGIFGKIGEALKNADFNTVLDLVNGGLLASLILGLKKIVNSMGSITDVFSDFSENTKGIISSIKEIFNGVIDSMKAYQSNLNASTLLKISGAIAILTAALLVLSSIDSGKLAVALGSITALFIELFGAMFLFQKLSNNGIKSLISLTSAMILLSTAVLVLSFALKNISNVSFTGVIKGIIAINFLTSALADAANDMTVQSGRIVKGTVGLIAFSTAVLILSSAVKKLSELNIGELVKGLISVKLLMDYMDDVVGIKMSDAIGLIALATSLNIMAAAVKQFGGIDLWSLAKGLGATALALLEFSMFVNLTSKAGGMSLSSSVGLVLLSTSLVILANAISKIGSLDLAAIGKALYGMGIALIMVGAAMSLIPATSILTGAGLVIFASGLLILAGVLKILGGMSVEAIGKSLIALGGSLVILAAAMTGMILALPGALALMVVAKALGMILPSLIALSLIPFGEVFKGMMQLAGAFTLFGLISTIMALFSPLVMIVSLALSLLGVALISVSKGMLMFAAATAAMSGSFTAMFSVITGLIYGLIELLPNIIIKIAKGITGAAGAICEAISTVLIAVLGAITNAIPSLMECLGTLLDALLNLIITYIQKVVDVGMKLIIGLLQGIASKMPDIVAAAVDIIVAFLESIGQQSIRIVNAGYQLIVDFINGLANSIRTNTSKLMDAIGNLVDAIIDALGSVIGGGINIGKNLIQGMINGIKSKAVSLANTAKKVVSDAWNGVLKFLGIKSPSRLAMEAGGYVDEGLIIGFNKYGDAVEGSAVGIAEQAMNGMYSAMSNLSEKIGSSMTAEPSIRPVFDMTGVESATSGIDNMFSKVYDYAQPLSSELSTESHTTVNHTFGTLKVEGVNDENEFVASADYVVEEVLTELMRRQNRL